MSISLRFSRLSNLKLFLITFVIYGLFAHHRLSGPSDNNHFAYQAEAFLAGQLSLRSPPPHQNDWASYEVVTIQESGGGERELKGIFPHGAPRGDQSKELLTLKGQQLLLKAGDIKQRERRYFVSFPPLPAVMMIPWVAISGLNASDVWLTIVFAALNAVLIRLLVRHVRSYITGHQVDDEGRAIEMWLTISLIFASAHLWCGVRGEVWFTALIIGVTAQLLTLYWGWGLQKPLLAGLAYSAAFSTRASLITLALFIYLQLILPFNGLSRRTRLKRCLLFSIPPLLIGCLLLYYNYVRFEQWYEFGHRYLAGGQISRIKQYGLFDPVFLSRNVIAAFALLPIFSWQVPLITYSWHGMAIQMSSPHLLWSILAFRGEASTRAPRYVLICFVVCTLFLLLLYQNTGWVQYSWRFILDLAPAMTVLMALSISKVSRALQIAIYWGIIMNVIGAIIFGHTSTWWHGVNLPPLKLP